MCPCHDFSWNTSFDRLIYRVVSWLAASPHSPPPMRIFSPGSVYIKVSLNMFTQKPLCWYFHGKSAVNWDVFFWMPTIIPQWFRRWLATVNPNNILSMHACWELFSFYNVTCIYFSCGIKQWTPLLTQWRCIVKYITPWLDLTWINWREL